MSMNVMKLTEIMPTGRLCKMFGSASFPIACNLRGTDKYAKIERSRLEVIFKNEPRCNWDGICNVEPSYGERKDSIDSLGARERKKT